MSHSREHSPRDKERSRTGTPRAEEGGGGEEAEMKRGESRDGLQGLR